MDKKYITITGINYYYDKEPFKIGGLLKLTKEPDNKYDSEAIAVQLPFIGTVGYVSNSPRTTYLGTCSAGRIYDIIKDMCFAKVLFITHCSVIAEIVEGYSGDEVDIREYYSKYEGKDV